MTRSAMPAWEWSYSKSKLLAECPRAFEFSMAKSAKPRQQQHNLRSLHGTAIHEGIAHYIGLWGEGLDPPPEVALAAADTFLKTAWSTRAESLIEMRNGAAVAASDIVTLRKRVRGDLKDFFRMLWPRFESSRYDSHETRQRMEVAGARVTIQIDFSCWSSTNDFRIVDWKTGGDINQRGGGPQLAVYALWAHDVRKVPVEKIRPMVVSVRTGEIIPYRATLLDFDRVRMLIFEDHATIDAYWAQSHFPANPEPRRCIGCRHMSKCDEGRQTVAEKA